MKNWKNIGLGMLLWGLNFSMVLGQDRINFSAWAGSEDIIITQVGGQTGNLNFSGKNGKVNFLVAGSNPVVIGVGDPQAVVYRIEAPSGFDITVELTAPSVLTLVDSSPAKTIPLTIKMAYSNEVANQISGFPNPATSVPVPPGFNSVTFPISRRTVLGGPPLPPSIAFGDGNGKTTRDKSSAFVFIYGDLGQVPPGSPAGNYTASVELRVYAAGN